MFFSCWSVKISKEFVKLIATISAAPFGAGLNEMKVALVNNSICDEAGLTMLTKDSDWQSN
jgi:hypothetical protein